jgi:hypothetical protein
MGPKKRSDPPNYPREFDSIPPSGKTGEALHSGIFPEMVPCPAGIIGGETINPELSGL